MFRKIFRSKAEEERVEEISLSSLMPGAMVDYDLDTYEVTAVHRYRYEGDFVVREYQLKSASKTVYLEREEDDEVCWSLSEKVTHRRLTFEGKPAGDYVIDNDRAPAKVEFDGEEYSLEEESAAHYMKQGTFKPVPVVVYDFAHADGKRFVTLERWGEEEFEAAHGREVREFDFTNLLPPPETK